ncbi:MAG: YjfK family protein [Xanthomonadales bacterium]|nr:YjfK family protein [Xanthomonadales bacterium]
MLDFLKKAFRARQLEKQPPPLSGGQALPLGLRMGAAVTVDPLPLKMLGAATLFHLPEDPQVVEARGEIDLGQGTRLHRFYLSDDLFLQVNAQGASVEDLKLFQFHDTVRPGSRSALDAWLRPGSELGQRQVTAFGQRWERCWGEPHEAWAPPVVFDEKVWKQGVAPDYDLTHYAMLYQRPLPNDRWETLLISLEDAGPNDFSIVYSIGIDLSPADLEIV